MSREETLLFIHVAHFLDHFLLLVFPTAALAIGPAWGMTYADALLHGTPIYVSFAVATPVAGWLGDKIDKATMMSVFFVGCGLSCFGVALSGSSSSMMIWLGALGVFAAIYHPVGLSWVTELGLRTGRALAINGVFGNLGLAGATAITGFLAQNFGWQAAFAVPGVFSVLMGFALYLRHKTPSQITAIHRSSVARCGSLHQSLQLRIFGIVCISALFGGLIFNCITVMLPGFFDQRLNMSGSDLQWIGASAGFVFAVAACAQLPVGELLDRVGAKPVLIVLLGVQILCLLLLTAATGKTVFFLSLVLVTFVFAEIPVTSWLLGRYLAPDVRARALSVEYTLSLGVGAAVVPLLAMSQRHGIGFDAVFVALAVAAAVILVAAWFLPNHSPRDRRHPPDG